MLEEFFKSFLFCRHVSGHASEDDLEPTTGSMDLVQIQAEAAAQQSSQDLGSVSEGSAESLSGENPGDEQDRQEDAMGMDRDRIPKTMQYMLL